MSSKQPICPITIPIFPSFDRDEIKARSVFRKFKNAVNNIAILIMTGELGKGGYVASGITSTHKEWRALCPD